MAFPAAASAVPFAGAVRGVAIAILASLAASGTALAASSGHTSGSSALPVSSSTSSFPLSAFCSYDVVAPEGGNFEAIGAYVGGLYTRHGCSLSSELAELGASLAHRGADGFEISGIAAPIAPGTRLLTCNDELFDEDGLPSVSFRDLESYPTSATSGSGYAVLPPHVCVTNVQCETGRYLGDPGCGDANYDEHITTADALVALRRSVGLSSSFTIDSMCDVNDDGSITAPDALLILRVAVHGVATLNCPLACYPWTVGPPGQNRTFYLVLARAFPSDFGAGVVPHEGKGEITFCSMLSGRDGEFSYCQFESVGDAFPTAADFDVVIDDPEAAADAIRIVRISSEPPL